MLTKLYERVEAEVDLYRHNKRNRQGKVSPDAQVFHVIQDVLPEDIYRAILDSLDELGERWHRSNTPWRDGAAIGGLELRDLPGTEWLAYLSSDAFLAKVRAATGIEQLQYVPEEDTNRLSLLQYVGSEGAAGDGIDWHVDGSIYLGQRWAGILTLIEDTVEETAKLELSPNDELTTLSKADIPNSLVLFRGDHVQHRVRPMNPGEHRVVLSLLFSDWPVRTMNPFLRRYQSGINQIFYGNPEF
jgi:hypothetical protein